MSPRGSFVNVDPSVHRVHSCNQFQGPGLPTLERSLAGPDAEPRPQDQPGLALVTEASVALPHLITRAECRQTPSTNPRRVRTSHRTDQKTTRACDIATEVVRRRLGLLTLQILEQGPRFNHISRVIYPSSGQGARGHQGSHSSRPFPS